MDFQWFRLDSILIFSDVAWILLGFPVILAWVSNDLAWISNDLGFQWCGLDFVILSITTYTEVIAHHRLGPDQMCWLFGNDHRTGCPRTTFLLNFLCQVFIPSRFWNQGFYCRYLFSGVGYSQNICSSFLIRGWLLLPAKCVVVGLIPLNSSKLRSPHDLLIINGWIVIACGWKLKSWHRSSTIETNACARIKWLSSARESQS